MSIQHIHLLYLDPVYVTLQSVRIVLLPISIPPLKQNVASSTKNNKIYKIDIFVSLISILHKIVQDDLDHLHSDFVLVVLFLWKSFQLWNGEYFDLNQVT